MDRRGFLRRLAGVAAVVVAAPVLAVLPKAKRDPIIDMMMDRRRRSLEEMQRQMELAYWGDPSVPTPHGIQYWVVKSSTPGYEEKKGYSG